MIWAWETPKMLPNRMAVACPAKPLYSAKNSVPTPRARDNTIPIASSVRCSLFPAIPIAAPQAQLMTSMPSSGDRLNSTAPVAPVKPTCPSASTAKPSFRTITKYPTSAPRIAATEPASSALRTKSYPR